MAKTLEHGCFDAFFFADVHGTYDVYRDSRRDAIRHGVQIPCYDPTVIIRALASHTTHPGFATTYSITYHAPYAAKLFSTLDHLTGLRRLERRHFVSARRPTQRPRAAPLARRALRASRGVHGGGLQALGGVWEGSWDDDAFVQDAENDVLVDPSRVREIHHKGKYYDVLGPHICDPSPQRPPVIYQAGSSDRGIDLGARHGEALFAIFPNVEVCAEYTARYRERLVAHGRDAAHA